MFRQKGRAGDKVSGLNNQRGLGRIGWDVLTSWCPWTLGGPFQEAVERQTWSSAGPGCRSPMEGVLQSTCKCPQRMWQMWRAGGKAESWEGAPGHSTPLPHGPVTVMKEHVSRITARGTTREEKQERSRTLLFQELPGPSSLRKDKTKFLVFQAQREGEKTVSFVLILARAPLFHRTGWLGTPDMRAFCSRAASQGRARCPGQ